MAQHWHAIADDMQMKTMYRDRVTKWKICMGQGKQNVILRAHGLLEWHFYALQLIYLYD